LKKGKWIVAIILSIGVFLTFGIASAAEFSSERGVAALFDIDYQAELIIKKCKVQYGDGEFYKQCVEREGKAYTDLGELLITMSQMAQDEELRTSPTFINMESCIEDVFRSKWNKKANSVKSWLEVNKLIGKCFQNRNK
jgi:hypothetical protein